MRFQYPLRVEVGCNPAAVDAHSRRRRFQYPLRVEVGCNQFCKSCGSTVLVFQYPLRVEVGCNAGVRTASSMRDNHGFSTHYRSKWVETSIG